MASLVIDSSLTASWCFPDEQTVYTNAVLRAVSSRLEALAPRLWAYEIRNSVLVGVRRQRITQRNAKEFLELLGALPICLIDRFSYDSIFELANRHQLTVCDAACLDAALSRDLPLATLDKALHRAAAIAGVTLFEP